uniref:Uncharacterized protein n=1 Tax=Avena sativa TaxID=4498 RepID=A0ACD5W690_AVESA
MAAVADSEKAAPGLAPPAELRRAPLILRLLLFKVSLTGLILLLTAKQTVVVPVVLTPPFVFAPVAAQFRDSPALIYLLVALCMAILYSLLTAFSSLRSIRSSASSSAKRIFVLIVLDVYHAGIMASATGTAGGVGWVGLRGNEHTRWNKVCNVYDKFCRHMIASTVLSLIAAILLLILTILNANTLYRRSR